MTNPSAPSSPDWAWVDDQLLPLAEARIPVLDLGFLRGLGVFETTRTYHGQPHALDEHLQRLEASATTCGFRCPIDATELRRRIALVRQRRPESEFRINLILTPGDHIGGVFEATSPRLVILLRQLSPPPAHWYSDGIRVVTFAGSRVQPESKTTAYLSGRAGLAAAAEDGAEEALYRDEQGFISEGVTSNVLLVSGGELLSPNAPSLAGITRAGLIDLAADAGLPHRFTPVHHDHLLAADEVWICSSVRELVPVIAVDGQPIADGRPGPRARQLIPRYHQHCVDESLQAADVD